MIKVTLRNSAEQCEPSWLLQTCNYYLYLAGRLAPKLQEIIEVVKVIGRLPFRCGNGPILHYFIDGEFFGKSMDL